MIASGFDTETRLIRPAQLAPPGVCFSLATAEGKWLYHFNPEMMPNGPLGTGSAPASTAREAFIYTLSTDPACGLNTAYDLAVALVRWPELYPLVFKTLDEGRIIDVGLCQQLIDNAHGKLKFWSNTYGYSLQALERRLLGRDRSAQKTGPNVWRLRYRELEEVPLHKWPTEAVDYALEDATGALEIFEKQWNSDDRKFLKDAPAQQQAAFALHLLMCWGTMTDPVRIEALRVVAEEKYWKLSDSLVAGGLVRGGSSNIVKKMQWTRDTKAAKQRMNDVCREAGIPIKLTLTGYKKLMKALEGVPADKRSQYPMEQLLSPEEILQYTSVDEDACKESGDETLMEYSLRSQLHSVVNTHVPDLLKGVVTPIQPRYTTMVETGRTACSKSRSEDGKRKSFSPTNGFQFQNPKRSFLWVPPGQKKAIPLFPPGVGIRECFVAREYKLFADNDYSGLELHTGAQACLNLVGQSMLAVALNAGMDPHLDFAAGMMGISYEEAKAKKHETEVKYHRQLAKCFHPDTEVLTKSGWVKLRDLDSGVEVAAASFSDGGKTNICWEIPTRLTHRLVEELVHLKNENIDLLVTPDHRMAAWKKVEKNPKGQIRDPKTGRMVNQGGKQNDMHLVHEFCTPEEMEKKRYWPSAGLCETGEEIAPEALLRLAVAVQADGSYKGKNYDESNPMSRGKGETIVLGFTKLRKIERMERLLQGWRYEKKLVGSAKVTTFYLPPETAAPVRALLDSDKTIPWWWLKLSFNLRCAVLDEIKHWDSYITKNGRGHFNYSTTVKKNADVLQALASITGRKASVSVSLRNDKAKRPCADCYHVNVKNRPNTRGGNLDVRRVRWGKSVYCLTVPSDAVLVRYSGKVTVTHQCANFGLPGGLGWRGLLGFSRGYGVKLTEDEAKKLIKDWFDKYPEWHAYFRWIRDRLQTRIVKGPDGKETMETTTGDFEQLYVGRVRGRCRYTDAANGFFQALGADVAKHALYEVAKRCYTQVPGPDSVLYGVRPVGFIHDEILAEVDEHLAHEQAFQMAEVMVREGNKFLPDVPVRCAPALSKRWCKEAEAVFNKEGRLQAYDLAREGKWEVYYDQKAEEKVKW